MIRKPNNWNEVQEFANRPKLPVGAYVCKIKKAVVQNNDYGDQLCVLFDILEGDYRDFYNKEFAANTSNDKKWKGVLRLWIPNDDGSDKDEITKRVLKGFITSVEKSNLGYQFDWNEASLTGKILGVLYRNEEWSIDGKTGWASRPFRALPVDSVRNGDYTLPAEKPLANLANSAPAATSYVPDAYNTAPLNPPKFEEVNGDDDLPF